MPRLRSLTGRNERQRNRTSARNVRTANVTNVPVRDSANNANDLVNLVDILSDRFRIALQLVPRNFDSYSVGQMTSICRFCGAKHFIFEVTNRDRDAFTLCCHKGKVFLSPFPENQFFKELYDGLSSNIPQIKSRSKNYFENIRNYNSAFAMVSSEASVADTILQGVYHFKIHNVFYHRNGPLTAAYGRDPFYAQLYFYDVDTANAFRMRQQSNESCRRDLMNAISRELHRINPFIQSFLTMKEHCERVENAEHEMSMLITTNSRTDVRRFNDATATDVAVIFKSVDGEPPYERNMITFSKTNAVVKKVSVLDPALDPMAYPLLFPSGETGWHVNIAHNVGRNSNARNSASAQPRDKVTMLQYACYRLALRDDTFSLLHHSKKLFLQWIVDMYVRIEGSRLHYLRNNQANLRSELYCNLTDHFAANANTNVPLGRRVILPTSFVGSPRNMHQNYLDAMSIVSQFGKPSLFITMTCNPNWPEIVELLENAETANFRPELIVRVFKGKLKELIHAIVTKEIFGKVVAIFYTIEFQKRGLPHAHILITLKEDQRIQGVVDIDKTVCAEIPDPNTHPKLHEYVVKHMMHGPCGLLNPNSVCMRDGKCTKEFPKNFNEVTREAVNGYPLYRRRDNGITANVRGQTLDNRYVVPYNPYLLAKFNCHINVEVCTTVKSVKYIYKYIYKGYDSATIQIQNVDGQPQEQMVHDEISNFLNARYVGSTEAMWRIFEYPMHYQSHTIVRLDIHLENSHNVIFRQGNEMQAAQRPRQTKLLAYFKLNEVDVDARAYRYVDIPEHYVWDDAHKIWKKRRRGSEKVIARMYAISPKEIELFHLRLLLLHVTGVRSFLEVKFYNGVQYATFVEACHARGIASNDNEWREALNEAKNFQMPKQLRELFAVICALNVPANALALWNEFRDFMSEDFARVYTQDIAYNRALIEIEEILLCHNMSCKDFGLPVPTFVTDGAVDAFDVDEQQFLFDEMLESANQEQRDIIRRVIRELQFHDTGSNVFCLTAHAGCGKTFVQTAIIHRVNALNRKYLATAFSGIAATLLIGGRTLHNAFKLPIPLLETSVPKITPNSPYGRFLDSLSLIIIDEVSMCPLQVLKIVDKLLKDVCSDVQKKHLLFAGKTILMCGDFRQILPVMTHGTRATLIENCIVSWTEFESVQRLTLNQNMRALPHEIEFVEFLKRLGNGTERQYPEYGSDMIEIPQHLLGNCNRIIEDVFGDVSDVTNILSERVFKSVILAPKNEDCHLINEDIMSRMAGEAKVYNSYDKVICEGDQQINDYPVEFLNSLNVSGLPPHKLKLKVNCIVLLIRNLNSKKALVNGTRLRVKAMHRNAIDCEVLTGTSIGERILIPRINLTYSGPILPFNFQRTQFPLIPAFAMTINKSQGQTFERIGILLREPVFTHGQLYVAASRVRSFNGLRFYIVDSNAHGHLANDERVFTKNIVYRELLNY